MTVAEYREKAAQYAAQADRQVESRAAMACRAMAAVYEAMADRAEMQADPRLAFQRDT